MLSNIDSRGIAIPDDGTVGGYGHGGMTIIDRPWQVMAFNMLVGDVGMKKTIPDALPIPDALCMVYLPTFG